MYMPGRSSCSLAVLNEPNHDGCSCRVLQTNDKYIIIQFIMLRCILIIIVGRMVVLPWTPKIYNIVLQQ
jgi:hypothetical protein